MVTAAPVTGGWPRGAVVVVRCCEREATGMEGPEGHGHDEWCTGFDPRPRYPCCHEREGDGHGRTCGTRIRKAARDLTVATTRPTG